MTWEVRAVEPDGTLVSVIRGVNVESIRREINAREECELSVDPLEADATLLDLFSHEIQVWRQVPADDPIIGWEIEGWFRPARLDADVSSGSSTLRCRCEGLFGYFHDEVIGGQRNNHIPSPHEEAPSLVGFPPANWTASADVEDVAVVENNAEFWQVPVSIQANNSEPDQQSYISYLFTVPAEFDLVPFAAMGVVYVADAKGSAPAYGGAAYKERGLVIRRHHGSTGDAMSKPKIATFTDEMPRNEPVRLQTEQVLPRAGEKIEIRAYVPAAWTAWRFIGLYDGRALKVDRQDKSAAFVALVEHAQNTTLGKQNRNIATDVVSLSEPISLELPWWRRDVIGQQIEQLADTFEFEMAITATTRTLRLRRTIGTDRSATVTLTKENFAAWGLGTELGTSASRVIRQGEGSGIARDEWWVDDPTALNGHLVESVSFGAPGESLQRLRDAAAEDLSRLSKIEKLPRATVTGTLAATIKVGDTVAVDIDHGWAQFSGDARVMKKDTVPAAVAATLYLEAVT